MSREPYPTEPLGARSLRLEVDGGHLELSWYGWGEHFSSTDAPPRELLDAGLARRGQRDGGSEVAVGTARAWVKGGRLRPGSARRHGLRQLLFQRPFPRLSEARNLAWLRARGLAAVRPLLAGLYFEGGRLPCAQFLATEFQPGAALDTLATVAPARHAAGRVSARALVERMHAASFEHRDCFERNFLITDDDTAVAIDTWRGGPRKRLTQRAIARDLAAFDGS